MVVKRSEYFCQVLQIMIEYNFWGHTNEKTTVNEVLLRVLVTLFYCFVILIVFAGKIIVMLSTCEYNEFCLSAELEKGLSDALNEVDRLQVNRHIS